ncbi:MAG: hypothetical protein ACI9JL_002149 [Paracoccaceae bacterium]|jgi:hypothetical protein
MEQVEKPPVWGRLFVAGLIFAGIGLTGASIVTRLQAIENYPRVAYDILQQSCDTRALADPLQNVNARIPTIEERPC